MLRLFFLIASVTILCQGFATAEIIVSYSGGSVAPGGTGFVDVLVSSDALPGAPDELDSFSGHFRISPVGGAVSNGLQFVASQSDSQLANPGYVFFNDSLTPPPIGSVSTSTNTNDTYVGGDATLSGFGVPLHNLSGSFLLYRLDLDAALANAGDMFEIELINDPSTDFLDTGFTPLSIDAASFTPFTVTAAVPEPSATVLLAIGTVVAVARRRRKHKPHFL